MTDTEIRIAVAEACGWKWSKPHYGHDARWHSTPYCGEKDIWDCDISEWAGKPQNVLREVIGIPDYPNDLNAIHEAEKTVEYQEAYASRLGAVLMRDCKKKGAAPELFSSTLWHFAFAHATARQRAEALLRTLGKWKE